MFKPAKLPIKPGIYKFLDNQGRILYIGKAKNLKSRVNSYFSSPAELSFSKRQMVRKISKVEYILVGNETEALILEKNLIKKYLPLYNVDLKDDKSWLYVAITDEKYPKVILTRKFLPAGRRGKVKNYFGPYTSAFAIRQTLRMLRKIFPFYEDGGPMVNLAKNPKSKLHLGRYLNRPTANEAEWRKNIALIKKFLNGEINDFQTTLRNKMLSEAEKKNFEQASIIRDQLKSLKIIGQKQQVLKNNEIDDNYLIKIRKNFQTLEQLKKIFKLANPPLRIEAYDISNISGQMAVGSMAVLTDGEIDSDQYRRFKIKTVSGANDPAMIAEVIKRRINNNWPLPDLMVIDGGKAQLNAAFAEIKKSGLKIHIISIAKKREQIYTPFRQKPLKLSKFSTAFQLLQKARDEAHRFAVCYYRKLHIKHITHN